MSVVTSAPSSTDWENWAGNERARATSSQTPGSTADVVAAVERARAAGTGVKMMGTGHSFTAISAPEGEMLRPQGLTGLLSFDRDAMTATVASGTQLKVLNQTLARLGVSLHNMGDIAEQTLAGATSTGTHGSGGHVAGLSGQLAGLELVTGTGQVITASETENPDVFALARVGLGALGIITQLTFRVEPQFLLRAEERPMTWHELVEDHERLAAENHHTDIHWFPHTDHALLKANNRLADPVESAEPVAAWKAWLDDEFLSNTVFGMANKVINRYPGSATTINGLASRALSARTYSDLAHKVFVSPRTVRFKEMEYALPAEAGIEALREARRWIDASGLSIGFPIEVRTAPADDVALSTSYGRPTTYLAFHVHHQADHARYFREIEAVMTAHGGRPHWGKMHTRDADYLRGVYPRFEEFLALRDQLDPDRVFANDYLRRVLGD